MSGAPLIAAGKVQKPPAADHRQPLVLFVRAGILQSPSPQRPFALWHPNFNQALACAPDYASSQCGSGMCLPTMPAGRPQVSAAPSSTARRLRRPSVLIATFSRASRERNSLENSRSIKRCSNSFEIGDVAMMSPSGVKKPQVSRCSFKNIATSIFCFIAIFYFCERAG
jgi:hypothetical protein